MNIRTAPLDVDAICANSTAMLPKNMPIMPSDAPYISEPSKHIVSICNIARPNPMVVANIKLTIIQTYTVANKLDSLPNR